MDERFYHYYFEGIQVPITILAANKKLSRSILESSPLPETYKDKDIISETTSQPIPGISFMMHNGKKKMWIGKDKSPSGWQEEK